MSLVRHRRADGLIRLQPGLSMPAFADRVARLEGPARSDALASAESLLRVVASSHRFRRDTRLGSIMHHRRLSFRELAPTDSLHVVFHGSSVSAHVDRVSPLNLDSRKPAHYAPLRVLAHNVVAMADHLRTVARGKVRRHVRPFPVKPADLQPSPDDRGDTVIPFSIIDEAVHLLDSEAAPWSIQLEVRVTGRLDEGRLRVALTEALRQHPMARARKKASRRALHHDSWQIPPVTDLDPLRVVDCPDDQALERARAELQSIGVPLAESPPLRVRLARHPGGDMVMLNVNHAAMDGFGALRVLRSLARAYAGDPDPLPTLDFLHARELPARLAATNWKVRARRQLVLAERLRDLVAPPARLVGEGDDGEPGYGFHQVSLSTTQTAALIDHGGQGPTNPRPTVNDVLLAALHLAIAGWNADHGARCGRIGVLVPANLRPGPWRHDMVGNFSLPARISTSRRSRATPAATLDAVTTQTSRKKTVGMGTALIEILGRSRLLPLWGKQVIVMLLPVTGNRLVDTAMLSNLGRLDDIPSFGAEAGEVDEIWFSPPARMPLGLSLGVATMSGRLFLSFRYRRRMFGPEAAAQFALRYQRELERFITGTG